ncbi:anti-sigma factor [Yinghuangia sp. YIM S09857]|uniref:anti-sigma factor n=1 Tax=Yinghuangia sp. YIM S09857 TaxID=3436929 RepID=UPI003F52FC03
MRDDHGTIHLGTGAYALDALTERERTVFENHLRTCGSCRTEARELAATAARLGGATPGAQPPDDMRERVMRAIRTVRQEGPPPARPLWNDRLRRHGPRAVLAACLVVAGASGGIALWQHDRAQEARSDARDAEEEVRRQADRQAQLGQVLSAPDARAAGTRFGNGATGTVVVSAGRNQAVFLAAGLPEPPPGSVYQLWYARDGHMAPAGFLPYDRVSSAALLTGGADGATAVGVTVEPDGGSPQPTSAPVAVIALPV